MSARARKHLNTLPRLGTCQGWSWLSFVSGANILHHDDCSGYHRGLSVTLRVEVLQTRRIYAFQAKGWTRELGLWLSKSKGVLWGHCGLAVGLSFSRFKRGTVVQWGWGSCCLYFATSNIYYIIGTTVAIFGHLFESICPSKQSDLNSIIISE